MSADCGAMTFDCQTDSTPLIVWNYNSTNGRFINQLYNAYDIHDDYLNVYQVKQEPAQYRGLVLKKTSESEAGSYTCIDREGQGEKACAEFVRINGRAECRVTIVYDNISEMCCGISYAGNIAPSVTIKNKKGNVENFTDKAEPSGDAKSTFSKRCIQVNLKEESDLYTCDIAFTGTGCGTTMNCPHQYSCKQEISLAMPKGDNDTGDDTGVSSTTLGLSIGIPLALLAIAIAVIVYCKKSKARFQSAKSEHNTMLSQPEHVNA